MIWIWLFFILGSVILSAFLINKKIHNTWRRKGATQTDPVPFLGDSYYSIFKGESMYELLSRIYNSVPESRCHGFYQFQMPQLMIKDPEIIKEMCIKDFDHFTDHKSFFPDDSDPLWDKNLLSLKGQKWKEMRMILSPSFTGSKMRLIFTFMNKCAENFATYLNKTDQDLIEIDLKDAFTRYANDIIATTAFGVECDSLKDRNNEFYLKAREVANVSDPVRIMKLTILTFFPFIGKLLGFSVFSEDVTNFFRGLIKNTLEYRSKNMIERQDILNLLMKAKKEGETDEKNEAEKMKGKIDLSLDDITSQTLVFFFAGLESISSSMCFLAYELALNPDIQQKLIEELDAYRETAETPTYEGLNKLDYFDMVISETMRKWPPNLTTDRACVLPYTIEPKEPGEDPIKLSPGDILAFPILALHHDPKYWENPARFDPERFSPENKDMIVPYSYLPFGLGPRNCIGMRFALIEIKVVFYAFLEHFEIVPIAKSPIPYKCKPRSFILTTDDFWFGLKRRVSKHT